MHKLVMLMVATCGSLALHAESQASPISQDVQELTQLTASQLLDVEAAYANTSQSASLQLKFRLSTSTHNDYELSLVGMFSHQTFVFQTYANIEGYLAAVGEPTPLEVPADHFYPGEPIDVRALAKDGSHFFEIRVIPNRFVVSRDSYFLELRPTSPACNTFEAIGTGFEPGDRVQFVWIPEGPVSIQGMRADSQGQASTVYSLATEGTTGGSFVLKMTCRAKQVSVTFPWGDEFLQTYFQETK